VPEPSSCAAVIPCFNERATIAALVRAIRSHLPSVIVVDDGSTDQTADLARAAGAAVLSHPRNLGKGAAIRSGFLRAKEQGFEWAFTMDGDGQHSPGDLPAFLHCAQTTGAELVVGNRMQNARAIPWLRRRVNLWMSRQLSRRAGRKLPDTQCGFRLVHLPAWATLSLRTEHFEIESEMLMAFLAAGHPVEFVPIQVIGPARRSHIHPLNDTWRWWKWWGGEKRTTRGPVD
jgi:glycosyltransferase involved in cell wall biosynthesis